MFSLGLNRVQRSLSPGISTQATKDLHMPTQYDMVIKLNEMKIFYRVDHSLGNFFGHEC